MTEPNESPRHASARESCPSTDRIISAGVATSFYQREEGEIYRLNDGARYLLTLMFLGLWFCASRAGLVALPFVLGACIYVRASSLRELAIAVMCAAILASALAAPGLLAHGDSQRELAASITPDLMRSPELNSLNNKERLLTIFGGWQLFVDHPIFGAGLGAFRHQEHVSTSGQPLLIHSSPIWLLAEMGIVGFLIFAVPVLHILLTEVRRPSSGYVFQAPCYLSCCVRNYVRPG